MTHAAVVLGLCAYLVVCVLALSGAYLPADDAGRWLGLLLLALVMAGLAGVCVLGHRWKHGEE